MRPKDPDRLSINPRELLTTGGKQALEQLLRIVGYVIQAQLLNDLSLSLRMFKALLLAGFRGSGKTAVVEDLAKSCNLDLFVINGHEGISAIDMIGGWDREEQAITVRQAVEAGMSLTDARKQKWDWDFYEAGEFLMAYKMAQDAAKTGDALPILLIDEVEKLPFVLQHVLLQALARGFVDIPNLQGIIGVEEPQHRPIVILTSNNLELLSEPLLSRCFVSWMEPPAPREEVRILHARVPEASQRQIASVASLIKFIRDEMPEIRSSNKPTIRESVDLLGALVSDGVTAITTNTIREYAACLGKGKKELAVMRQNDDGLVWAAENPGEEITEWVSETFNESKFSEMGVKV